MKNKWNIKCLWCIVFTGCLLGCTSAKSFAQWSFKQNYRQYGASTIGTNTVYRLLEDPYNFIWMFTDKGILIFNGESYTTIRIPGDKQEIVNICRYKNIVYASSYAGRLYQIDMLSLAVKEIPLPEPTASESTFFLVMNVIGDKLYLSKGQGSFIILDLKKNNRPILVSNSIYFFRFITHSDLSQPDFRFLGLWYKALNDKIFAEETIYYVDDKKLKVFYAPGNNGKRFKTVSSYLQDDRYLYVGFLESGGLVKYKNYDNKTSNNIGQTVLPNIEVGDILKDQKGNIWVSTLHDGVFVLLNEEKNIQQLSDKYNFYSNDIWYIKYKHELLNIGYKQLVVDQLKYKNFSKRWIIDTNIHYNPVTLFHTYGNKAIILGNRSNYISNTNLNAFIKRFLYKDNYIYNGEIYATSPGTVHKFSKDLEFSKLRSTPSEMKFNTFFPLTNSGYLKGGVPGVYVNNVSTKIKDHITKVRKYNGDILACSDNGLYIKRKEKYFHITQKNGLPDNYCIQIEYRGGRYYQLLTKQGLSYIDTANCKVAGSLNANSLGNDAIIHHFDVENDTIWLATSKGIFTFNEQSLLRKTKSNITAYLYPEQLTSRINKYKQQTSELKYSKERTVKMIVEVLNFLPKDYYMTYEIQRDNKTIAQPLQLLDRSFFVSTPDPGNYTIKLHIGNDKNNIDKTITYLLKITPLWYQILWVRVFSAIILVVALGYIIKITAHQIIKEKEKRFQEKYAILQLQSQAFFTQLNPHFIFNALTPLQSHILKNEKIESLEYLDRFSSLMRDILKNSDKMETSLKKEINFINEYIAIQQIRFSPSFIFELAVSETIDLENTSIPAMMLQPIIENAIEHGVKNMGAAGKISVEIGQERIRNKACIRIQISDNGSGITGNILKEGHALYILQKRVQTLQKKDNITASLTHGPGPDGTGTTFKLILPETSSLWSTGQ
ncbi:sensor histidine kinase [Niabella sp. 22666]|uniref:sensor histidine kinase n=1 Tax=Niabella sp. 22666 TaxID=3453954 RepID=UPI003F83A06C